MFDDYENNKGTPEWVLDDLEIPEEDRDYYRNNKDALYDVILSDGRVYNPSEEISGKFDDDDDDY